MCTVLPKILVETVLQACHDDWDNAIHLLIFAYNSSVHASTKVTPFELMYGREPILPIERLLEVKDNVISASEYATNLREHLKLIRDIAKENLLTSQNKAKEEQIREV